jgi:hypothetical protein
MRGLATVAGIALVLADGPAQRLVLPASSGKAWLRIECPVGQSTDLVFPEMLEKLKRPNEGPMVVTLKQRRPEGVVSVRPGSHPSWALLEFKGPTLEIDVRIDSRPAGPGVEARIVESRLVDPVPAPATPPTSPPVTVVEANASPVPEPSPERPASPVPASAEPPKGPPSMPSPDATAGGLFDLKGLVRARFVPIGRTEGLPGQLPMTLVDAALAEDWVWLRFQLTGGAPRRVDSVLLDQAPIQAFEQVPEGKNLRVFVQIPRVRFGARARVVLSVAEGPSYTFAPNSWKLGTVLKGLFR